MKPFRFFECRQHAGVIIAVLGVLISATAASAAVDACPEMGQRKIGAGPMTVQEAVLLADACRSLPAIDPSGTIGVERLGDEASAARNRQALARTARLCRQAPALLAAAERDPAASAVDRKHACVINASGR